MPLDHVALSVADRERSAASYGEHFQAASVTETERQEYGPTRVQVADPDGYRVEVYAF